MKRDPQTIEDFLEAPACEAQLAGPLRRIHAVLGNDREAEAMKERSWALTFQKSAHLEKVHIGAGLGTGARRLGRAGLLHIAAHARYYDAARPLFTSIELAPDAGDAAREERLDGHLHLYEIYDLDLRGTRLAVVSACDTALGPRDEGDLTALTRAFLYAGVPTVITTLWSIDDPASSTAPAAALRAAQLEVLRGSGLSHPYFWAAFTLTGNPID